MHLNECNHTELYQRCIAAGRQPHQYANKEELILTLLGEMPPAGNAVDVWRDAQMQFILDRWDMLRPQITRCPAISKDPKACHQCTDMQVFASLTIKQESNLEEIKHAIDTRKRT